jgi:mercuric ion transport protein
MATANNDDLPKWSWWGMISGLIGAQLCCGIPWLLLSLGVSGSLISQLEAIRPYRPFFIAFALVFLIAGWIQLEHRKRKGCPIRNKQETLKGQ